MLTDSNAANFDISVWKNKIVKKLIANINHYPTETLRIAYVNNCVNKKAYKHLAARSKIGVQKLFATAKEIFEIL